MVPFRTRNVANCHTILNSLPNVANFQPRVVDFQSSPSSGENKGDDCDDKMFGDTVPCEEDTCLNNDEFDTQVVDDDNADGETQAICFADEMEAMELAGETQVMDDDCNFVDHMGTQRLEISNTQEYECDIDGEGFERTENLDHTVCAKFQDSEATPSAANEISQFHQNDGGTQRLEISNTEEYECDIDGEGFERTKNLDLTVCAKFQDSEATTSAANEISQFHQNDGGLSRRGFASVRTASLRAAGLAARQSALKNANRGSSSTVFSSLASKCPLSNDGSGMSNVEAVGIVNDVENMYEDALSDKDRSVVNRSLARKLFLKESSADMGSDGNVCERREDFFELPCDNNVAGLSYVDSQEPGELSQANALNIVDNYLKVSVFESAVGAIHNNAVAEIASPSAIAKGAHSIAQQASRKSAFARGSIFEWDDDREDEGGGEFFTKKKEELLGTISRTHKSCPKPWSSNYHEPRKSQSVSKLQKDKGKQNSRGTMDDIFHCDLMLVNGGGKGEVKEIDIENHVDSCAGQQIDLASGIQEALNNSQSVDIHNVGIDTQMAAEAIEALSAGNLPVNNYCSIADNQVCQIKRDRSEIETVKKGPSKHSKQNFLQTSRVTTRSRSKRNVQSHGQSVKKKFDVGVINSRTKRSRLVINDSLPVHGRESSGTESGSAGGKQTKSILDHSSNSLSSFKRRGLRGTAIIATPAAECIEHHLHINNASGSSGEQNCLEVLDERRRRTKNNVLSENCNCNKTVYEASAADSDKADGFGQPLNKKGVTEHASIQDSQSRDKSLTSSAYGDPLTFDTIARRTRSRKSDIQCAKYPRNEKSSNFSGMLSLEDTCQLSSKKQDACLSPVKGTLDSVKMDGLPTKMKQSANPVDNTPVNLKTPRSISSPICVGDGYYSPSCKKSLSLQKELMSLIASEPKSTSPYKGLRLRRDIKNVRVLFSQHLDDDIVRQQKKILSRLGVSLASSISEASHFVADMFVRTRNMLEAIANAKPVVTHLWLESCGQANCFIDEKSYILRDANKEKKLGFSMAKSLANARQHPLLKGKKVLITPNVKPAKEVITSLVKAVHGQAVERLGRYTTNDELFVLSCEEDFGVCVPLLEKGIAVYSSELLLNGIITQRLEYERYRLFLAHVKKTRSTLWLNKSGGKFLPVNKTM